MGTAPGQMQMLGLPGMQVPGLLPPGLQIPGMQIRQPFMAAQGLPWGVVPAQAGPVQYTGQPTGPNGQPAPRLLFPSAQPGPSPSPQGAKPTFPAYSGASTSGAVQVQQLQQMQQMQQLQQMQGLQGVQGIPGVQLAGMHGLAASQPQLLAPRPQMLGLPGQQAVLGMGGQVVMGGFPGMQMVQGMPGVLPGVIGVPRFR